VRTRDVSIARASINAKKRAQNRTLIDRSRDFFLRSNSIASKKQPQVWLLDQREKQTTIDH